MLDLCREKVIFAKINRRENFSFTNLGKLMDEKINGFTVFISNV